MTLTTFITFLAEIIYGKTLEFDEAIEISKRESTLYKKRLWLVFNNWKMY